MQWTKDANDDPHGVQKLLSLLRTQQDGDQSDADKNKTAPDQAVIAANEAASASASQLPSSEPAPSIQSQQTPSRNAHLQRYIDGSTIALPAAQSSQPDLRYISFAQALPHLSRLSKDEKFLEQLLRLKAEQDQFEKDLFDERAQLQRAQGSNGDDAGRPGKPLSTWDRQALARWDGLYARQQERLQLLGVPCFFATADAAHLRRQQRVFDVLSGLLE